MDIYDDLVETWDKHYKQKHENKSLKYEKDWSYPRCYLGKIGGEIPIYFIRFWEKKDMNEKELTRLWNMGKKPEVNKETKELNTLHENITDLGHKIEKMDIKRLFSLGFDRYELLLDGVIRKYMENKDKDDEDIQRILTVNESKESEDTKIFEEWI
ncbi:hypothetical protein C1646_754065 [Rhizophagus diaphanus]|nr:hypothetical protein C1646_754065 [Rhizophagus diaphanus] [Rhizophagus sp. MUCL 43196]